jgi:Ubiquitin carboxyl-terminal hydrolase
VPFLIIVRTARSHGYTAALRLSTQSLVLKILILGTFSFLSPFQLVINDFRFYNKTCFSGLETHILNSYTNAVVQVMHYVSPIRRLAKAHILIDCPREHCLFCELGFVSCMLEDAQGTNCQASNFCKTVGVLAQGFSGRHTILPFIF